jgi:hypothetical protein
MGPSANHAEEKLVGMSIAPRFDEHRPFPGRRKLRIPRISERTGTGRLKGSGMRHVDLPRNRRSPEAAAPEKRGQISELIDAQPHRLEGLQRPGAPLEG